VKSRDSNKNNNKTPESDLKKKTSTTSKTNALGDCPNGVYNVELSFTGSATKKTDKNKTEAATDKTTSIKAKINIRDLDFTGAPNGTGIGWKIMTSMDKIPENIKKFFYSADNNIYLPFKHFKDWATKISTNSPKQITASFISSNNQAFIFTCTFDYDPKWDFITSSQITKIRDMLISNTSAQALKVTIIKKDLSSSLNDYMTNMVLHKASSSDAAANQKTIEGLKNQIEGYEAKIKEMKEKLKTKEKEAEELKGNLSTKQQVVKENENAKSITEGNIEALNTELETLRTSKSTASSNAENYAAQANNALASIKSTKETYYQECANMGKYLDEAVKVLTENLDTTGFVTNLNKAFFE
jgi:hypothetical protein